MTNLERFQRFTATVLAGNLLFLSIATPCAQAATFSPYTGPGQEILTNTESGFFDPHQLRNRLDSQQSVVRQLKQREERQDMIRVRSLQNVLQNVQENIQQKFANKEEFEAEMERRRRASAALFGAGENFKFVKFKDDKKVWFKGGQVSKVENEKSFDAHGTATYRNMENMDYDAKGLLISYKAETTDATGHKSTTRWYGATYTDDSVSYGGEGTKFKKLITSYTQETTDDRGNTDIVRWSAGTYNEKNQLTSYTQTNQNQNGQITTKVWNGAQYDDNRQLTAFREVTTNEFGKRTERNWSGATYQRNPSYVDMELTPGQSEYLLSSYHEELTDERGQKIIKDWSKATYSNFGDLTGYEETSRKNIDGVELMQKVEWKDALYDEWGRLTAYNQKKVGFDGLTEKTEWRDGLYDDYGRVISYKETTVDQDGNAMERRWRANANGYDAKNHLASYEETTTDSQSNTTKKIWTASAFDVHDRVLAYEEETTDAAGKKQSKTWNTSTDLYDEFGQIIGFVENTQDDQGNATQKRWNNATYDAQGHLTSYNEENVDVYGQTSRRTWSQGTYDILGRVTSYLENRTDPEGNRETSAWSGARYDAKGNLLAYHEEFVNDLHETSVKDWRALDNGYDARRQLIAFTEVVTGFDGLTTQRERTDVDYDRQGRLTGYHDEVTVTHPISALDLAGLEKAGITLDDVSQFQSQVETHSAIEWRGASYDSQGRMTGYTEQTKSDGRTQNKAWSGTYSTRGELIHSEESLDDKGGLSSHTVYNAQAFDLRGRASQFQQIQIFSDEPGVSVMTLVKDRRYDRQGQVSSGIETVITGGTTINGEAFNMNRTTRQSNASFSDNRLAGYEQDITTTGTDSNLNWIDNNEQRIVKDLSRTGYEEESTTAGHTVVTKRSNIVRDSQGQILSYTDSVLDKAQAPEAIVTKRLATAFNARGEMAGSIDQIAVPNGDNILRITNHIETNLRGQQIKFMEKSIRNPGANAVIETKERTQTEYDALNRVTKSIDQVTVSNEKEKKRIVWEAFRFDSNNRVARDRSMTEKFNSDFSSAADSFEENNRSLITYNDLGQIRSLRERIVNTLTPDQVISKETSDMTYDSWGKLATSHEVSLTRDMQDHSSRVYTGDKITDVKRSEAQFDDQGRLLSYFETVHETGRSTNGDTLNRYEVHHRTNMQYDGEKKDRLLTYDEEVTNSATPSIRSTIHHENNAFDSRNNVIEYHETTRKTGALDIIETVHRSDIQVNNVGLTLSYREESNTSERPAEKSLVIWNGTYDAKKRLASSHQENEKYRSDALVEKNTVDRSGISYNLQDQMLSYEDHTRRSFVLDDGSWSQELFETTKRERIGYDSLGHVVTYRENSTQSHIPQTQTVEFSNARYDSQGRLKAFEQNTFTNGTDSNHPLHLFSFENRKDTHYNGLGLITETWTERRSIEKADLLIIEHAHDYEYDSQGRQTKFVIDQHEITEFLALVQIDRHVTTTREFTAYDDIGRLNAKTERIRRYGTDVEEESFTEKSNIVTNAWGEETAYSLKEVSSSAPDRMTQTEFSVSKTDQYGRALNSKEVRATEQNLTTIIRTDVQRDVFGKEIAYKESSTDKDSGLTQFKEWGGTYDENGRLVGFSESQRDNVSDIVSRLDRTNILTNSVGIMVGYEETSTSNATPGVITSIKWRVGHIEPTGRISAFKQEKHLIGADYDWSETQERTNIAYLKNGLVTSYDDLILSDQTPGSFIRSRREFTTYDAQGREATFSEKETTYARDLSFEVTTALSRLSSQYDSADRLTSKREKMWSSASPNLNTFVNWNGQYDSQGRLTGYTNANRALGLDHNGLPYDKTTNTVAEDRRYDSMNRLLHETQTIDAQGSEIQRREWTATGFNSSGQILSDIERVDIVTTQRDDYSYDKFGRVLGFRADISNIAEPQKSTQQVFKQTYDDMGRVATEDQQIRQRDKETGGERFSTDRASHRENTYDNKNRLFGYVDTSYDGNTNVVVTDTKSNITYNELGLQNGSRDTQQSKGINGNPLNASSTTEEAIHTFDRFGRAQTLTRTLTSSSAPTLRQTEYLNGLTYDSKGRLYGQQRRTETEDINDKDHFFFIDFDVRLETQYDDMDREIYFVDELRKGATSAVVERVESKKTYNDLGQQRNLAQKSTQLFSENRLGIVSNSETTFSYNKRGLVEQEERSSNSSSTPALNNVQIVRYTYGDNGTLKGTATNQLVTGRAPPMDNSVIDELLSKPQFSLLTDEQRTDLRKQLSNGQEINQTTQLVRSNITQDSEGRQVSYLEKQQSSLTPAVITEIIHTSSGFNQRGHESGSVDDQRTFIAGQPQKVISHQVTTRSEATYDSYGRAYSYKEVVNEGSIEHTTTREVTTYNDRGQVNATRERANMQSKANSKVLFVDSVTNQTNMLYDDQGRLRSYDVDATSSGQGESNQHWEATAFNIFGHAAHTSENGFSSAEGFYTRKTNLIQSDAAGRSLVTESQGTSTINGDAHTLVISIGKDGKTAYNQLGQNTYQVEIGEKNGLGKFSREFDSSFVDSFDERGRQNHTLETLIQTDKKTVTEVQQQQYNELNQVTFKHSTAEIMTQDATQSLTSDWSGAYDNQGRLQSFTSKNTTRTSTTDTDGISIDTSVQTRSNMRYNKNGQLIAYGEETRQDISDERGTKIQATVQKINRENASYNEDGQLSSYDDKGTRNGNEFVEHYEARRFDSNGNAVEWTKSGNEGGKPTFTNQTNATFDARGQMTAYQQNGISDGQFFNKSADQLQYDGFGRNVTSREHGETDAGSYENVQHTRYDIHGRIAKKTEDGIDAGGTYHSETDGFQYDLQGRAFQRTTTKTNDSGEKTVSIWQAGPYDAKGRLKSTTETETVTNKDGALVSSGINHWQAKEYFDNDVLKSGESVITKTLANGTVETTTRTNNVLAINAQGQATATEDISKVSTLTKAGIKTETSSTVSRSNIERYTDEDQTNHQAHHAGRIAGFNQKIFSSDKNQPQYATTANIKYDQKGDELASDTATISSSLFTQIKDGVAGLIASVFSFLRNIVKSLLNLGRRQTGLNGDEAFSEYLDTSKYQLDVVQRTNEKRDSNGRVISWTETTRTSASPAKISINKVDVVFKGSGNEYRDYHSLTTEESPEGRKIIEHAQTDFEYDNGKLVGNKGHIKEGAFDRNTGRQILDHAQDYEDQFLNFDAQGRAQQTIRITTNDTAAPQLVKKDVTNFTFNAAGQVATRKIATAETGQDGGIARNKQDTLDESYTYNAAGQVLTTHRESSSSSAPGVLTIDDVENLAWDSAGRLTQSKTTRTTRSGDADSMESWTDQMLSFDANNQVTTMKRASEKDEGSVTTTTLSQTRNSYDAQGRLAESITDNDAESRTGDQSWRHTWTQVVRNREFDGVGQATRVARITSADSENPTFISKREELHFTFDAQGRAKETTTMTYENLITGRRHTYETNLVNHEFDSHGRAVSWTQTTRNDSLAPGREQYQTVDKATYDDFGNLFKYHAINSEAGFLAGDGTYRSEPQDCDYVVLYDDFHRQTSQKENNHTLIKNLEKQIETLSSGDVLDDFSDMPEEGRQAIRDARAADLFNLKGQLNTAVKNGFTSNLLTTYTLNRINSVVSINGLDNIETLQKNFTYNDLGQRIGMTESDSKTENTHERTFGYDEYGRQIRVESKNTEMTQTQDGTLKPRTYTTIDTVDQFDIYGRDLRVSTTIKNDEAAVGQVTTTSRSLLYDSQKRVVGYNSFTTTTGDGYSVHTRESQRILEFDALGRALLTEQTMWSEAAPNVTQKTTSRNIYGMEGKQIGSLRFIEKNGGPLNTSLNELDLTLSMNLTGQATSSLSITFGDRSAPDRVTITRQKSMAYNALGQLVYREMEARETGNGLDHRSTSKETFSYDAAGRLTSTKWDRFDSAYPDQRITGTTTQDQFDSLNRATHNHTDRTTTVTVDGTTSSQKSSDDETIKEFNSGGLASLVDRKKWADLGEADSTSSETDVQQRYDQHGRLSYSNGDIEESKRSRGPNPVTETHRSHRTIELEYNRLGQADHTKTTTWDTELAKALPTIQDVRTEFDSQGLARHTTTVTTKTSPTGDLSSYRTQMNMYARDSWGNLTDYDTLSDDNSLAPDLVVYDHVTNARYKNGTMYAWESVGEDTGIDEKGLAYSKPHHVTHLNTVNEIGQVKGIAEKDHLKIDDLNEQMKQPESSFADDIDRLQSQIIDQQENILKPALNAIDAQEKNLIGVYQSQLTAIENSLANLETRGDYTNFWKKIIRNALNNSKTNLLNEIERAKASFESQRAQLRFESQVVITALTEKLQTVQTANAVEAEDRQHTQLMIDEIARHGGYTSVITNIQYNEKGQVIGQTRWDSDSLLDKVETGHLYNEFGQLVSYRQIYTKQETIPVQHSERVALTYDRFGQIDTTTSNIVDTAENVRRETTIIQQTLERDRLGRVTKTEQSVIDQNTPDLISITITSNKYDTQGRVVEYTMENGKNIRGLTTMLSVTTKHIDSFDALGRAKDFTSIEIIFSSPNLTIGKQRAGARKEETGTVIYGKDGQAVGEDKIVAQKGRELDSVQHVFEIKTAFDVFGRPTEIKRVTDGNPKNPSFTTVDVTKIDYQSDGNTVATTQRKEITPGYEVHTFTMTDTVEFGRDGNISKKITVISNDSNCPDKQTTNTQTDIQYNRYGQQLSYKETTNEKSVSDDGKTLNDTKSVQRSNITYTSDGLVYSYREDDLTQNIVRDVTATNYDGEGHITRQKENQTWQNNAGGKVEGLSDWKSGSVTLETTYTYDNKGRVSGQTIKGSGTGTRYDSPTINQNINLQVTKNNYHYDSKNRAVNYTQSTILNGSATNSNVEIRSFNSLGQATNIFTRFNDGRGWGWSHQTNIKYGTDGSMSSATTESWYQTTFKVRKKTGTATFHSKKEQTFTKNADGKTETKDTKVEFDVKDIRIPKSRNFFKTDLGVFTKHLIQAVADAIIPGLGTVISLAINFAVMYREGATPREMWRSAAITAAAYLIGQGVGQMMTSAANPASNGLSDTQGGGPWAALGQAVAGFAMEKFMDRVQRHSGKRTAMVLGIASQAAKSDSPATTAAVAAAQQAVNAAIQKFAERNEKLLGSFGAGVVSESSGHLSSLALSLTFAFKATIKNAKENLTFEKITGKVRGLFSPSINRNFSDTPRDFFKGLAKGSGFIRDKEKDQGGSSISASKQTTGNSRGEVGIPASHSFSNSQSISRSPMDNAYAQTPSPISSAGYERADSIGPDAASQSGVKNFYSDVLPPTGEAFVTTPDKNISMVLSAGMLSQINVQDNGWGGQDKIFLADSPKLDTDRKVVAMSGTIERETPQGKVKMDWSYAAKNSEEFQRTATDLRQYGSDIPHLSEKIDKADAILTEKSKDGEMRKTYLKNADSSGTTVLISEHRDKKGTWTLMSFDDVQKDGTVEGTIYTRNEKQNNKYQLSGTFVEGSREKSAFMSMSGSIVTHMTDPNEATHAQEAFKQTTKVHVERDIQKNLTREVGYDTKGNVAYVFDAKAKTITVFGARSVEKFKYKSEDKKGEISGLAKVKVSADDLASLTLSLPNIGPKDTAATIGAAVKTQEKVAEAVAAKAISAKENLAAQADVLKADREKIAATPRQRQEMVKKLSPLALQAATDEANEIINDLHPTVRDKFRKEIDKSFRLLETGEPENVAKAQLLVHYIQNVDMARKFNSDRSARLEDLNRTAGNVFKNIDAINANEHSIKKWIAGYDRALKRGKVERAKIFFGYLLNVAMQSAVPGGGGAVISDQMVRQFANEYISNLRSQRQTAYRMIKSLHISIHHLKSADTAYNKFMTLLDKGGVWTADDQKMATAMKAEMKLNVLLSLTDVQSTRFLIKLEDFQKVPAFFGFSSNENAKMQSNLIGLHKQVKSTALRAESMLALVKSGQTISDQAADDLYIEIAAHQNSITSNEKVLAIGLQLKQVMLDSALVGSWGKGFWIHATVVGNTHINETKEILRHSLIDNFDRDIPIERIKKLSSNLAMENIAGGVLELTAYILLTRGAGWAASTSKAAKVGESSRFVGKMISGYAEFNKNREFFTRILKSGFIGGMINVGFTEIHNRFFGKDVVTGEDLFGQTIVLKQKQHLGVVDGLTAFGGGFKAGAGFEGLAPLSGAVTEVVLDGGVRGPAYLAGKFLQVESNSPAALRWAIEAGKTTENMVVGMAATTAAEKGTYFSLRHIGKLDVDTAAAWSKTAGNFMGGVTSQITRGYEGKTLEGIRQIKNNTYDFNESLLIENSYQAAKLVDAGAKYLQSGANAGNPPLKIKMENDVWLTLTPAERKIYAESLNAPAKERVVESLKKAETQFNQSESILNERAFYAELSYKQKLEAANAKEKLELVHRTELKQIEDQLGAFNGASHVQIPEKTVWQKFVSKFKGTDDLVQQQTASRSTGEEVRGAGTAIQDGGGRNARDHRSNGRDDAASRQDAERFGQVRGKGQEEISSREAAIGKRERAISKRETAVSERERVLQQRAGYLRGEIYRLGSEKLEFRRRATEDLSRVRSFRERAGDQRVKREESGSAKNDVANTPYNADSAKKFQIESVEPQPQVWRPTSERGIMKRVSDLYDTVTIAAFGKTQLVNGTTPSDRIIIGHGHDKMSPESMTTLANKNSAAWAVFETKPDKISSETKIIVFKMPTTEPELRSFGSLVKGSKTLPNHVVMAEFETLSQAHESMQIYNDTNNAGSNSSLSLEKIQSTLDATHTFFSPETFNQIYRRSQDVVKEIINNTFLNDEDRKSKYRVNH